LPVHYDSPHIGGNLQNPQVSRENTP
jgi:hypothetical protein